MMNIMNFMKIQPENFLKNASYMGKGMLGIFVAIGIIVIVTLILNSSGNNKD